MEIPVKISIEKITELRNYILELMKEKDLGFNQLKIKANLNSKALTDILYSDSKERISPFYLQKLAYALKIDYKVLYKIVGYLDEKDFDKNSQLKMNEIKYLELPVYGKASAGNGYINLETTIRKEKIILLPNEEMPENIFMVEVHGNSMFPTLIEGDLVVVDPKCETIKNNELYVVSYKEETYIKRVVDNKGYIQLISDNSDRVKYPDIIIMKDELESFICNGVVIEAKRKFRR